VQRIWAAHGLKPKGARPFKLSNDPKFAAKVQDVVGRYIDPPEHALVLSVDDKSPIHALDRIQRRLSMTPQLRHNDPLFQALRRDDAVRRLRCARLPGHWPVTRRATGTKNSSVLNKINRKIPLGRSCI
jgi:hypothetical protein